LSGRLAARCVTIGRAGIAKIESGRRAVSDYEIVGIAHALSVPITWLLDGKPVDGKYSTDGKYRHGRDAGGKSSGGR
jgi:transcriptional regulator with XRE-family HTH domain